MKYPYIFYQLPLKREIIPRMFENYDRTLEYFGGVDFDLYKVVDSGTVEADSPTAACEALFWRYNDELPKGYHGRSMSVSDIVTLTDESVEPPVKTAWFCDNIGFVKLEIRLT